jgi:hypothetical protein
LHGFTLLDRSRYNPSTILAVDVLFRPDTLFAGYFRGLAVQANLLQGFSESSSYRR